MTGGPIWLDVLRAAAQQLADAGVEGPARDARLLLADALGVDGGRLIAIERDEARPDQIADFDARIARRVRGEPVSRIRGRREFFGLDFVVTPAVLDPRPDTEALVQACLDRMTPDGRVLDLGTGSGCILLALLAQRPRTTGLGVDISAEAVAVAERNASRLGMDDRAMFQQGDWATGVHDQFDLIVSNPPYIPTGDIAGLDRDVRLFDPEQALDGGADGLDPYRAICGAIPRLLRPGGWLGFEFGLGQGDEVAALMREIGLEKIELVRDLAGRERAAVGRRPAEQEEFAAGL
jgi:release factor glutamine methyltransferase